MLALRIEDHVPDLIIEEIRDLGLIQAVEDTSIWNIIKFRVKHHRRHRSRSYSSRRRYSSES